MSFKDDLKDDVQKVFCNSDEFFEEHEVDGKLMMISIDDCRWYEVYESCKRYLWRR